MQHSSTCRYVSRPLVGRVKVRFHWDRESTGDESSSASIRVAVPAGRLGESSLPEVGDEVLVGFFGGDGLAARRPGLALQRRPPAATAVAQRSPGGESVGGRRLLPAHSLPGRFRTPGGGGRRGAAASGAVMDAALTHGQCALNLCW